MGLNVNSIKKGREESLGADAMGEGVPVPDESPFSTDVDLLRLAPILKP